MNTNYSLDLRRRLDINTNIASFLNFSLLALWGIKVPAPLVDGAQLWIVTDAIVAILFFYLNVKSMIQFFRIFITFFAVLMIHIILINALNIAPYSIRAFAVAFVLAFYCSFIYTVYQCCYYEVAILRAVKLFLVVFLGSQVADLIGVAFTEGAHSYTHYFLPIWRAVGLLGEPSHVAITLAIPLSIYNIYPHLWRRHFGLKYTIILTIIVLLCPSSTILIIIGIFVLWGVLKRNRAAFLRLSLVICALCAIVISINAIAPDITDPLLERIESLYSLSDDGDDKYANQSSLIFATSAFVSYNSLLNYPFGVGIDNYFYAHNKYAPMYTIYFTENNARDGSSFLFKLVTEIGVLPVLFLVVIIIYRRWHLAVYRSDAASFALVIAISILIANLIRGAGYFSAAIPIAISSFMHVFGPGLITSRRRSLVSLR